MAAWIAPVAGSLLGGLFGLVGANQSRIASERAAAAANRAQLAAAKKNIKYQKEFAQHGVRWKVEDAKAAGIHPLYALGAQTHSFSPISVGSTESGYDPGDTYRNLGNMASNMGQDIGRALSVTQTQMEKEHNALQIQMMKTQLEGEAIDNQIRLKQLSNLNTGPAFPTPSAVSKISPLNITQSAPDLPFSEGAAVNDVGWAKTKHGLVAIPSSDVKERIEDQFFPEMAWSMRNQFLPNIGQLSPPPRSLLSNPSNVWRFNQFYQTYQEVNPNVPRSVRETVQGYVWKPKPPSGPRLKLKSNSKFKNFFRY